MWVMHIDFHLVGVSFSTPSLILFLICSWCSLLPCRFCWPWRYLWTVYSSLLWEALPLSRSGHDWWTAFECDVALSSLEGHHLQFIHPTKPLTPQSCCSAKADSIHLAWIDWERFNWDCSSIKTTFNFICFGCFINLGPKIRSCWLTLSLETLLQELFRQLCHRKSLVLLGGWSCLS